MPGSVNAMSPNAFSTVLPAATAFCAAASNALMETVLDGGNGAPAARGAPSASTARTPRSANVNASSSCQSRPVRTFCTVRPDSTAASSS